MLIYSAGLRVSEVVKLKLGDIDTERKLIYIKGGKGRKDRYTILSDTAMDTIGLYMNANNPEKWLFLGKKENTHLTIRCVEKIFEDAVKRAGITKEGNHILSSSWFRALVYWSIYFKRCRTRPWMLDIGNRLYLCLYFTLSFLLLRLSAYQARLEKGL